MNDLLAFLFSSFGPHCFFLDYLVCPYFLHLACTYELSQSKPFKTVESFPLVGLEINLEGGSQHLFKDSRKEHSLPACLARRKT